MDRPWLEYYGGIDDNTKIYKYMSFSQFISLIENNKIYLSNINRWDDPWEAALLKAATRDENNNVVKSISIADFGLYGQCWSLKKDSDALWRIYSPNKEGVMIATTCTKIKEEFKYIHHALLGKVKYIDFTKKEDFPKGHHLAECLAKRLSFEHEEEVRFITDVHCIKGADSRNDYIDININPFNFIDEIIIDPRAEKWFVQTLRNYCTRVGFKIQPTQSNLYSFDRETSLKFYRTWIPGGVEPT